MPCFFYAKIKKVIPLNDIPFDLKRRCVELAEGGVSSRKIYDECFAKEHSGMSYRTFRRQLLYWRKKKMPDDTTLWSGTYEGFVAHNATVQVDADGKIRQAWIKQAVDEGQWDALIDAIHKNVEPVHIRPCSENGVGMLEIPLLDMHFPLSEHKKTAEELLALIWRKKWDEINIVIGQDLFHNDDMRGRTASGRQIEKVDIPKAWEMAKTFWCNAIESALHQSSKVNVIYSIGNHDESLAWAFVQLLKDRYPQANVDDTFKQRKCIYWKECFIGLTHGNSIKNGNQDMRGQFTIEFPQEFASSKVREIHSGHLHHEKEADIYGVMVRRLSRNGETDKWSEDEGFVGAHKRFMVFEWMPGRLKSIHYV